MAHSGSDSLRSTLAGESDSFRSILADGSDSFRSTLAGGSDSLMSTLTRGTDSLSSTLRGGHDYMFENCCDLCKQDELQKEAVGFCVDCQDYLCTECFRHHLKPKPSRHHVLLDQNQMHNREAEKPLAQHVRDIEVRSTNDRKTPWITGIAVLPGDKLVVVDYDNNKVKLIDLTHNTIVSQLELPSVIWDITHVSITKVAVTSYDTPTIYVINVGATHLNLDREVKVKGQCRGIASNNDKLIVSFSNPVKVEIISLKGQLLQTVVKEDKGRELLISSMYVAVSNDQLNIYISDMNRHTITSVDLTGKVQAIYMDDKLKVPYGLTVDSAGRVYVCGWSSSNILQLTADLTEIQELLQWSDGVVSPQSVYYCKATDLLFIAMWDSDVVKVYQLK